MTITTRKRVLGGLVAAGMLVALAGCASAPEETEETADAGSEVVEGFLPCMVSGATGRVRRQVVQPARVRGPGAGRGGARRRVHRRVESNIDLGLRAQHPERARPELHHGRSRSASTSPPPQPRRPRPTPTSSSSPSTTPSTRTSTARPTSRTSSRSSSTPPRRRSWRATRRRRTVAVEGRRHVRRQAFRR